MDPSAPAIDPSAMSGVAPGAAPEPVVYNCFGDPDTADTTIVLDGCGVCNGTHPSLRGPPFCCTPLSF